MSRVKVMLGTRIDVTDGRASRDWQVVTICITLDGLTIKMDYEQAVEVYNILGGVIDQVNRERREEDLKFE